MLMLLTIHYNIYIYIYIYVAIARNPKRCGLEDSMAEAPLRRRKAPIRRRLSTTFGHLDFAQGVGSRDMRLFTRRVGSFQGLWCELKCGYPGMFRCKNVAFRFGDVASDKVARRRLRSCSSFLFGSASDVRGPVPKLFGSDCDVVVYVLVGFCCHRRCRPNCRDNWHTMFVVLTWH